MTLLLMLLFFYLLIGVMYGLVWALLDNTDRRNSGVFIVLICLTWPVWAIIHLTSKG